MYKGINAEKVTNYASVYFVPFLIVLTFIGIINTFQYFYFHTSANSIVKLINIAIAMLLYSWYYLILLLQLSLYHKTDISKKRTIWILLNIGALIIFVSLHQFLSYAAEVFIIGKSNSKTLFDLLINNKAVWIDIVLYILFLFSIHLIEFKSLIHASEFQQSELQVELIKTRLTELRVKIQPNFLFSTLDSISGLLKENRNRDANQKLSLMSEFLRATIYDTDDEEITLEDELRYLYLYSEVERVTRGDNFCIEEEIEPESRLVYIPNFFIQPLVEEIVNLSVSKSAPHHILIKSSIVHNGLNVTISSDFLINKNIVFNSDVFKFMKERFVNLYGDTNIFDLHLTMENRININVFIPS